MYVCIYFLTLFCIFSLFLYHCPIIFMYYKFIISLGRFGKDSPPPLELSFYFSFRTILTLILYCSLWILGLACPFSKKHITIQKLSCNFVSIYNESIDLFGKNWHQWFRVLRLCTWCISLLGSFLCPSIKFYAFLPKVLFLNTALLRYNLHTIKCTPL